MASGGNRNISHFNEITYTWTAYLGADEIFVTDAQATLTKPPGRKARSRVGLAATVPPLPRPHASTTLTPKAAPCPGVPAESLTLAPGPGSTNLLSLQVSSGFRNLM